jgi:DNA-binding transcriptional ArsR family regulator
VDDVFKAVADPTRRAIIDELIAHNDQTLFELCSGLIMRRSLGVTRQAISKHIAVLTHAGLITTNPEGRTTIHHLDTQRFAEALDWLTDRYQQPIKENP